MLFSSEKKTVAGEGSEGAAYQQLAAAKTRPSEVSHFLTLAWQRDQGQTLATWLPKHANADPAVALGFSEKPNCTDCLKPEARTADSSAITLLIR